MTNPSGDQFRAWFEKNKTAVLVGVGVAALIVVAGGATESQQAPPPQQPPRSDGAPPGPPQGYPPANPQDGGYPQEQQPSYDTQGPGPAPVSTPPSGIDMEERRRTEAADDERQRERIRTIREEEKCRRADGSEDVVPIHVGC